MQTRLFRILPATFALYHFRQHAFCETAINLEPKLDINKGYIEPISKVFFTHEYDEKTTLKNLPTLKLVSAGVRCMLGESFMCDRPITRVYSYGLYIDHSCFEGAKVDFDTVMFKSPHIAKTISIEVTVGKSSGHWVGGFRKSILRRLYEMEEYMQESKEQQLIIRKDIKKFAFQFKSVKRITPESKVNITWHEGKVTTEIDGKVIGKIDNNFVGEAIFRTYYGFNTVNPQATTRARRHYIEGLAKDKDEHEQQEKLFNKGACPDYRQCGKRLQFW